MQIIKQYHKTYNILIQLIIMYINKKKIICIKKIKNNNKKIKDDFKILKKQNTFMYVISKLKFII